MNMKLSPAVRRAIYAVTIIGTPLVAYTKAKGWIGNDEVQLWSAEVAAVGTLAAVKVTRDQSGRRAGREHE